MNENEQQLDEDQEQELKEMVFEYAENTIEDSEKREEFIRRLNSDRDFYLSIRNALVEMAFLMSSAISDDESEFLIIRERILASSKSDTPEVERLRFTYLKPGNYSHMYQLATSDEHLAVFKHRMLSFEEDLNLQDN